MEKISVFLDDIRKAPDGYVLTETIDECLNLLQNHTIEHLSLDHDLLNKTRDGTMLIEMMLEQRLFANRITIHSANAARGRGMYKSLKQAQHDLIMPPSIIVSLRPLPLYFYPPGFLKHYHETL
ncbi:cyclic-phosphate processing receiver domain-containing protein [Bacillus sp. AK031]